MDSSSLAPCGVMCDLCLAYQRTKNRCVGCQNDGNKPYHCTVCSIKSCPEKIDEENLLCTTCAKFPCRRIKNLDKRYIEKYGESPIQNLQEVAQIGLTNFIKIQQEKWRCSTCGHLFCVHRDVCLNCGAENQFFPKS